LAALSISTILLRAGLSISLSIYFLAAIVDRFSKTWAENDEIESDMNWKMMLEMICECD